MTVSDQERGLYRKYQVNRVDEDGSNPHPLEEPFFVLRYTTDPHAVHALRAYAESCVGEYPGLATDLAELADRWEKPWPWPGYCQSCRAPLSPPDRTDCPSCGADDSDGLD